jgi:hypothetical protein
MRNNSYFTSAGTITECKSSLEQWQKADPANNDPGSTVSTLPDTKTLIARGMAALNTPPPACRASQYCCPDAKKCLTPLSSNASIVSCSTNPNACEANQVCCPLTKLCVDVGGDCTPPPECGGSAFCHFETSTCRTPVTPQVVCVTSADCGKSNVCDPITKTCVQVGSACTPP